MKRSIFLALVVAVLGRGVHAATADGTLITNVATATFSTPTGGPFAVTFGATATVIVLSPCVALQKVADTTVQAAGGTVTYTLWVVNCSAAMSAFNILVTDKLPDNMAYDAPRGTFGNGGAWSSFESATGGPTTYVAGTPPAGQVTPYYLRFLLDILGPSKSAYVKYSAVIL